ncbi:MAG: M23 family metallopeptidase [Chitinophagales bacterium]|nr:M23 family metallopeptidase [Chitinophagales bacterium]HAE35187.1 peptidase M23 [Bacteroidota bacterium]MCB9031893.1 M23 family metallopeptidase [Chitinophagales bacterium]HPE97261.1 M23 family metallopeptidase [Chitinophagales bacterium]HQU75195.1 M23 family metallopeptidase [Chitinophagales bacterium]
MSTPSGEKQNWRQRLQNKYRLVIMHDKTFEVETSVKLSMLNLIVLGSTLLVVMGVLVYTVIAVTPLKNYVSGYSEVSTTRQLLENSEIADSLMREMEARDAYLDIITRTLKGELDTVVNKPDSAAIPQEQLNIDTISDIDRALRQQVEQEDLFNLTGADPRQTGKENFRALYFFPPVKGTVTSSFDPSQGHYGTDIVAKEGTPIKTCLDGTVVDSYWSVESGNVIVIQHSYGLISMYKHNSQVLRKAGSPVRAGDVIAIIGNTGELSSGPHLHFELWHNKVAIDAEELIIFN